jgi:hypothetical protein
MNYRICLARVIEGLACACEQGGQCGARVDAGERHRRVLPTREARALVWRNGVPEAKISAELAKARVFAATEGYSVHVFPMSERKPLEAAKQAALWLPTL